MSDEKKYTAKEAAIAVLKKAEEVLKKAEVLKKEHKHIGWDKLHSKLEHEGYSANSADKIAGSIKAKVEKAEPVGEIHPKEPQAGEAEQPGARVKENAKEPIQPDAKVNSNPEWGTAPETYGTMKLAKFIGHMHAKRKAVKPAGPSGVA